MRFADFKRETEQMNERERVIRTCAEREWILPDKLGMLGIVVRPHEPAVMPGGVDVYINYSRWVDQPGSTYKIVSVGGLKDIKDGYFDHIHNSIGSLPMVHLGFVLQARSLIDQWVRGDLEELPYQPFV